MNIEILPKIWYNTEENKQRIIKDMDMKKLTQEEIRRKTICFPLEATSF